MMSQALGDTTPREPLPTKHRRLKTLTSGDQVMSFPTNIFSREPLMLLRVTIYPDPLLLSRERKALVSDKRLMVLLAPNTNLALTKNKSTSL